MQPARLLLRAASAKIAGLAGIGRQLTSVMVNTRMDWKHPTYYKALEKQRKEFEASERAQADKRARERASKRKVTSGSRASKK